MTNVGGATNIKEAQLGHEKHLRYNVAFTSALTATDNT